MTIEAMTIFKDNQKENWSLFAPLEIFTTMPAAALVNFAGVKKGATVLDVGCGTGVVAITAARFGAQVSGMDICPALIQCAQKNASIAEVDIRFEEADAESLPYPDGAFDLVLSQFGHMFAPRPSVVIHEMLRVLKPGGVIAFSTWPPDLFVGRMFNLVAKFCPMPEWASPPPLWGNPEFVRQQLGTQCLEPVFDQGLMILPALSLKHYRQSVEKTLGPIVKFMNVAKNDLSKIKQFQEELEALASEYYKDNYLHQHFLMSKAFKRKD